MSFFCLLFFIVFILPVLIGIFWTKIYIKKLNCEELNCVCVCECVLLGGVYPGGVGGLISQYSVYSGINIAKQLCHCSVSVLHTCPGPQLQIPTWPSVSWATNWSHFCAETSGKQAHSETRRCGGVSRIDWRTAKGTDWDECCVWEHSKLEVQ